MIRQLCFSAIAVLFATSSCFANFIIDDFSAVTTGTGQLTSTNATVTANTFTNVSGSTYQGVGQPSYSITYDFGGTLLALAQASNPNLSAGSLTSFGVPASPLLADQFELVVTGTGFTQTVSPSGVDPFVIIDAPGGGTTLLADSTFLTLTFNSLGAGGVAVDFGGAPFTAVPEPTSLLMFPAAIGLVLALSLIHI